MINVFLAFFVVMANSSRSILKHKHLFPNIFSSYLSSSSQMAAPGHGGLAAKKLLVTRMESEIPEPAVEMLKNQFRHFFLFIYDPKSTVMLVRDSEKHCCTARKGLAFKSIFLIDNDLLVLNASEHRGRSLGL